MAHPHLPPPFPICPILWATFPWPTMLSPCVLVRQPNLRALAHSAHCSCQIPMIAFRQFLSSVFSKPYQWLHWRVHWWPGWAFSPPAVFPFTLTSPFPADSLFYNWMAVSWDTGYLFGFCLERQQCTFLDQGSLMLHCHHNYKKYIFTLKLLLPSLSVVQFLAQIVCKTQQVLLIHMRFLQHIMKILVIGRETNVWL